jgi:hypothetical protein
MHVMAGTCRRRLDGTVNDEVHATTDVVDEGLSLAPAMGAGRRRPISRDCLRDLFRFGARRVCAVSAALPGRVRFTTISTLPDRPRSTSRATRCAAAAEEARALWTRARS